MAEQPDLFSNPPKSQNQGVEGVPKGKNRSNDTQKAKPKTFQHGEHDEQIKSNFDQINSRHKFLNILGRGLLLLVILVFIGLILYSPDKEESLGVQLEEATLNELEAQLLPSEFDGDASKIAPQVVEQPVAPAPKQEIPERIFLYSGPNERSSVISSVKSAMNLDVKNPGVVWSEVTSIEGIPVWISRGNAETFGSGYVIVTKADAKVYSRPQEKDHLLLGRLADQQVSRLILKNKDWFRVAAPSNFTAWVKTSDLQASKSQ